MNPNLWDDPSKAEILLRELKSHKNWVAKYEKIKEVVDDAEVLLEFQKMGEATEEEVDARYAQAVDIIEDVEFRSTLNREEDELSCLLEINAGAGGTEACDWAEMLYRMYVRWGEQNNMKVKELNRVDGDVAGIKSVVLEIDGEYAYGLLQGENGVHRLESKSLQFARQENDFFCLCLCSSYDR